MYPTLLSLHSAMRWLVLASLIFMIFRAFRGWRSGENFTKSDNTLRHLTATVAHVQMALGISLYYISPIIQYFLVNYREAVKMRDIRFFGMEHSLMMLVAVVLITLGSMKSKRQNLDNRKFRAIFIWYSIALLLILVSIPWPFSPMASRPLWRGF